ncbi:hypothetical protein L1276_000266 [Flavobacterium sp. HSC-32F16]|uniref:DUF4199 domain-containing protein n=1 Tax=Flavobacterium sp. HSC-32F16 TaxID=2910964 RepID=UPI0020A4EE4A|nr:DUF4199 domain-containing protein [Flavobacterium sp. HSC-32F16]MCP2025126.1 hypothetical protein [Flavobacterium sp. HSC-32F16]
MTKRTFLKSVFKQGIIMGLSFCLYTILMWLTKLDTTYLNIGQYLDIAIILLPLLMIFWIIKKHTASYKVTVIQRIVIAVFVGFISYLIYDPFLYIYHHYINPDWYNAVLNLKESDLIAGHTQPNKITAILKEMKTSPTAQADLFRVSAAIPSVIILPVLISLISLIFIKNKPQK